MATVNVKNVKIQQWSNSYIIRIPKAFIDNGQLEVGENIPLVELHKGEKQ